MKDDDDESKIRLDSRAGAAGTSSGASRTRVNDRRVTAAALRSRRVGLDRRFGIAVGLEHSVWNVM